VAKKSAGGNKSQAIRDALHAQPDASPKEIAESLKASGFEVTPAYVSIVKYNMSKASGKSGGRVVRRKVGRAGGGRPAKGAAGLGALEAAVSFVQATGGLDQAKQTLAMLESIRASL
jgi:hypothetical protein